MLCTEKSVIRKYHMLAALPELSNTFITIKNVNIRQIVYLKVFHGIVLLLKH